MPIAIFSLMVGALLGWAVCRKHIARRVRPLIAELDQPASSAFTKRAARAISSITGA